MASLFKRIFAVAEVDGITFYSKSALNEYLREKKRRERGLNRYTFRALCDCTLSEAMNLLEKNGVFDYTVNEVSFYRRIYDITYYSRQIVIVYKDFA